MNLLEFIGLVRFLNWWEILLGAVSVRILLLTKRESSIKSIAFRWQAIFLTTKNYTSCFNFLSIYVIRWFPRTDLTEFDFFIRFRRGYLHFLIKDRSLYFLKLKHPIFKVMLIVHLLSIGAALVWALLSFIPMVIPINKYVKIVCSWLKIISYIY